MKANRPLIVGFGGPTRPGSSSEKALLASLRAAQAEGAEVAWISGPALDLPIYAPEDPERSLEAQRMIDLLRRCDGLIVSSPSYHGSLSGMVKNALDYAEDMSNDKRPYLDGRAVGLIACAAGWQGAGQTLAALRSIAHALRGWPTPMGAIVNTAGKIFDDTGNCLDPSVTSQLRTIAQQVVEFARMRRIASEASLQAIAV